MAGRAILRDLGAPGQARWRTEQEEKEESSAALRVSESLCASSWGTLKQKPGSRIGMGMEMAIKWKWEGSAEGRGSWLESYREEEWGEELER